MTMLLTFVSLGPSMPLRGSSPESSLRLRREDALQLGLAGRVEEGACEGPGELEDAVGGLVRRVAHHTVQHPVEGARGRGVGDKEETALLRDLPVGHRVAHDPFLVRFGLGQSCKS